MNANPLITMLSDYRARREREARRARATFCRRLAAACRQGNRDACDQYRLFASLTPDDWDRMRALFLSRHRCAIVRRR